MNPDRQRIKLAEWSGLTNCSICPCGCGDSHAVILGDDNTFDRSVKIPRYLSDLNAVHELEKRLSAREKGNYASKLFQICNISEPRTEMQERDGWFIHIHATAAQRCEALLKTLNLWED